MRGRAALASRVEALQKRVARPRFLLLRATLRVHERSTSHVACPCCKSKEAAEVESRVIAELVIDMATGERIVPDEPRWAECATLAEVYAIDIRCSRSQEALVLDETGRHLFASGGNRSGKTTLGLYWIALQWMRRGGLHRRFWLIASTLPKAFRLLEKLFKPTPVAGGSGTTPAILPPGLVVKQPLTARASDLITQLVDGSLFDLRYFEGDPGAERLKSDPIVAALVTEASHMSSPDSLAALEGRTIDVPGRLFLDSTPRPQCFLKTEVVDAVAAYNVLSPDDERRRTGSHPGARWVYKELPLLENPWLPLGPLEEKLRTLDPESPQVARDFFGKWRSNKGHLWLAFSAEKHIIHHEARFFGELGSSAREAIGAAKLVECTAKVVRSVAGRISPHNRSVRATNMDYLLGQDVNCHPLSTAVLSFACDPRAPEDRDLWHVFVWDVIQTFEGNSYKHAEKLASVRWARILRPSDDTSPFAGACIVTDGTSIGRDPTAHRYGADPRGIPQTFGKLGFDCRAPCYSEDMLRACNPSRYDSHQLIHRLLEVTPAAPFGRLHISARCGPLVEAFLEQEDGGDGVEPATKSHTRSDVLASPMDAMRYALWAAFHGGRAPTVLRQAG